MLLLEVDEHLLDDRPAHGMPHQVDVVARLHLERAAQPRPAQLPRVHDLDDVVGEVDRAEGVFAEARPSATAEPGGLKVTVVMVGING